MGRPVTGTVIEKAYHPPAGAPTRYWCYIMVETASGDRVNIRLHQQIHDKVTVGDQVQFEKPRRKHKRVKALRLVRA